MWEQLGKIKNIKIVYNGGKYSYLISAADIYLAWFEENIRKNDLALNRQVHKIFHLYLKSERRFKKQKSLLEPEKMNNHMDYFAGILRKSYSLGLLVSGSFAIEHYLPFSLQSKTHDDLDFIVPRSDFLSNSEILLDQMRSFFPDLSRFVDLEKPQHRRKVFEADAMIDRKRQVVHVEFTDINVKSTPAQLNSRALKTKVCVLMPEMDYLVARLLVGAASVTRPWHRKLDDAAYLLSLFHLHQNKISKGRVFYFVKKFCGSESKIKITRARLYQVLEEMTGAMINKRRTLAHKPELNFNIDGVLKSSKKAYGLPRKVDDPLLIISKRMYLFPKEYKSRLSTGLEITGIKSDSGLWKAVLKASSTKTPGELRRVAKGKSERLFKFFHKRRM